MQKVLVVTLLAQAAQRRKGTKSGNSRFMNENCIICVCVCVSVVSTPVNILASNFLEVMEIMMKHCWDQFLDTLYIHVVSFEMHYSNMLRF